MGETCSRSCQLVHGWMCRRENRFEFDLSLELLIVDNMALNFITTVEHWSDTQYDMRGMRAGIESTCLRCLNEAVTASVLLNGAAP